MELVPYFTFTNLEAAVEFLSISSVCTILMNVVQKGSFRFRDPSQDYLYLDFVNLLNMKLSVESTYDENREIHVLINKLYLTGLLMTRLLKSWISQCIDGTWKTTE